MFKSSYAGEGLGHIFLRNKQPCWRRRSTHRKTVCQILPLYYTLTQYTPREHSAAAQQRIESSRTARKKARTSESQEASAEASGGRVSSAGKKRRSPPAAATPSQLAFRDGTEVEQEDGTEHTGAAAPAKDRRKKAAPAAAGDPDTIREAVPDLVLSDEEEQILDRRLRSHSRRASSRPTGWTADSYPATELIFKLERRGEGWGEEILPHLTVERRLLSAKVPSKRNRGVRPDPWEEGSPEKFLYEYCRIPEDQVDVVMTTATAWRVTPGGRPLIDRRRRSRVARNVVLVAEYLEKLDVPAGLRGVGKIFMQAPQLMLCKPTTNDRWDRRAVELAAHAFHHGTCNVSEGSDDMHDLGMWVKRQRMLWQQGALLQDRLQILSALGFEFGTEAQITEEWEYRFDQLVEWLLLMGSSKMGPQDDQQWLGLDWGQRGGLQGRECCIWVQLQRQLRARSLLPAEAIRRLESLNFAWEPQGGSKPEWQWMQQFGRLVFTIERSKKLTDVASLISLQRFYSTNVDTPSDDPQGQQGNGAGNNLLQGQYDNSWQLGQEERMDTAEHAWMQQEVSKRREALHTATLEQGLRFWLAKQQLQWLRGRLHPEQALLLRLLGVDFGTHDLEAWRADAHGAAHFLLGSQLLPGLPKSRHSRSMSHHDPRHGHNGGNGAPRHSGKVADVSGNGSCVAAAENGWPGKSRRSRVERWVLTQQALYAERRLSMGQIRYLALLELSWLLNKESVAGSKLLSGQMLQQLTVEQLDARLGLRKARSEATQEWVQQQQALHALGWLEARRVSELQAVGVSLRPQRSEEDLKWDCHLTELLAFRREAGSCRLPPEGWATAPELGPWLAEVQALWQKNKLSAKRLAQLSALGVERRPAEVAWLAD